MRLILVVVLCIFSSFSYSETKKEPWPVITHPEQIRPIIESLS